MYGLCKVHTASVGNCPPFRPILSALNTTTYKLAKRLVPILKPLTTNEFSVKDFFHFAEEIVDQQHDLFMGSKTEFKELLSLATKDSHFTFDGRLYKQIDSVAMGPPPRPYIS